MRPKPHGKINIVQDEYIKMTRPVRSRRQQLQDLNLVAQVKMIGRLVHKANWRILGEQGRDIDSPPFTAGKCSERSVGKPGKGGRKWAYRRTAGGTALAEIVRTTPMDPAGQDRPLLVELVRNGQVIRREPLEAAREWHRTTLDELPQIANSLSPGDPAIPTIFT